MDWFLRSTFLLEHSKHFKQHASITLINTSTLFLHTFTLQGLHRKCNIKFSILPEYTLDVSNHADDLLYLLSCRRHRFTGFPCVSSRKISKMLSLNVPADLPSHVTLIESDFEAAYLCIPMHASSQGHLSCQEFLAALCESRVT